MDHLLLHALSQKQRYNSLKGVVPVGMVAPDTMALMQWFGAYFQAFPEREVVQVDELISLIRLRAAASPPEQLQLTLHLVESLRQEPDKVAIQGILGQLYELDLSGRAASMIEKYQRGEEIDLAYELSRLSQQVVRTKAQSSPSDFIETPIGELLSEITDDKGIKFRRWAALRDHIAGLQGGASVAIAARPDKGKTSLIAAILTDFAPQVQAMYGADRPILWLNNEGSGKRIIPRIYQAALQVDLDELAQLSNSGLLVPKYVEALGGVGNLIRVKDMHGASLAHIEQVIEAQKPAVVVADMLSNFKLPGNGGGNKAEAIEDLWKEWRELMVRHDCVGLATVQISVEGGNMPYPPYSALKDSKTGIQGATDIILMMGSLDNHNAQSLRWLSSPKNKFAMPRKPSSFQSDIHFDASRCAFYDGAGATPGD